MNQQWIVFAIGFTAQLFFSARILVQWLMSERARKVLSPSLFWTLSLAGAYFLCLYGWLRHDFSIVLGQVISYYIYVWNLREKGVWNRLHRVLKLLLLFTPVAALLFAMRDAGALADRFFHNEDVPLWLLVGGSLGQVIFTLRFIYQWHYSYRRHESVLPAGFWIISLTGSSAIIVYGMIRFDPVLIIGQSFGFVAYIRNLCILHSQKEIPS
ncbi:lipid-A-disaccharide synthase N-terminal domain-containing protein [Bacteroides helcogenes]|uniref:Lipid A biosynthesis domain protein n=1 Tax=Bacteroides helcogenes (strain ATCC 35417 / DSM 20613 / JCM 6297 / CCUG 15421 / P 36-108) TaxID=693979 RepID=E6SQK5_BACT6|nr:lipid-A-disaccharide synthase N-terminal domain-containing protein [Bacteroides helcogenes]ADV42979.1 lipid A biosynthesis domain protein [Bacteroides helcogenes P 36-108]MDY5236978.1 lipid-A-disaccharide synthase N-terminal domain-containing protein [Bacteroides helcogenes]